MSEIDNTYRNMNNNLVHFSQRAISGVFEIFRGGVGFNLDSMRW